MSVKLWGVPAALAAIVQTNAASAQSDALAAWSVGDGWVMKRGDLGCGAFHDDVPFFALTQRLDGRLSVALRAPGGNFSAGSSVYLQFSAIDSAGQTILSKRYDGNAGPQSSGSLVQLNAQGDIATDAAGATRVIASSGRYADPKPVYMPVLRVMRRCLTELKRVDHGSGQPAVTAPVLLNPRSPLVTEADYPPAALREEGQGVTLVALTISAKGLISYCRVKTSSGRVDLDEQTCQSLSRRARYTPATDAQGNPTEGETTQPIRWQLPRD